MGHGIVNKASLFHFSTVERLFYPLTKIKILNVHKAECRLHFTLFVNYTYFRIRQYGGFALSHDDVEQEYDELKRDLRGKDVEEDIFYSVGYNSPFTVEGRRNEIWIEAED